MRFADNGIAGNASPHIAGDLAGGAPVVPEFGEQFNARVIPAHINFLMLDAWLQKAGENQTVPPQKSGKYGDAFMSILKANTGLRPFGGKIRLAPVWY